MSYNTFIQKYGLLLTVIILTVPSIVIRYFNPELHPLIVVWSSGLAIFSSVIILMWACEVAQIDIPQPLAIIIVTLIAVLPEYAVDMYFSWMAGQEPLSMYRNYPIANMTGANRLLIGVGWPSIIILFFINYNQAILIDEAKRIEIFFLLLATSYAFIIPWKNTLSWYDSIIFIGIYIWYIKTVIKKERYSHKSIEIKGSAKILVMLPVRYRRIVTVSLFLFSASMLLMNAELFSEHLLLCGRLFQIDEFLLVQWITPLASEAPEFIIAILLVLNGKPSLSLGSLLTAKLNQWTLLVGMIPLVYAISSGHMIPPMIITHQQSYEILLTASQSLFAICLLLNFYIGIHEAIVLFVLFAFQFSAPFYSDLLETNFGVYHNPARFHIYFSIVYIVLAIFLIMKRYNNLFLLKTVLTTTTTTSTTTTSSSS